MKKNTETTDRQSAINKILLEAQTPGEALRRMYEFKKNIDPKFSLGYLCAKAGMPSKGYLSDVMRGKRVLNAKYIKGMARAFSLEGNTGLYLKLLIEIADEKDFEHRKSLESKLTIARKALKISFQPMSTRLSGIFFAMDVFCAFGLFKNAPTQKQLIKYFGMTRNELPQIS